MTWLATKYLVTALIVVLASELAKRSDKLGALVVALPTVSILTLLWLYFDSQPTEKLANHAYYTFWYVIPTLPMFILFPYLLSKLAFWGALGAGALITIVCFFVLALALREFGISLH